jgi:hypothetical protein
MSTQATYDDANLILRLFELRRESTMREARTWFTANYAPADVEESMKIAPMGSKENAYVRMLCSYWEMAASFIVAGVLNQELFFESNGELLFVWERVRPVIPGLRALSKNPTSFGNLEKVGTAYAKWVEAKGPEAYSGFQDMVKLAASGR